jgi:DNA repair exonuclease SbcCD ATPase subunit
MLKSLSLRNFKKHSSLDVEFTAGVNGIFGPNYRGKSTILHGIMFCLGGASALPRGMSVETDGATGKFKQSLQFEAGGTDYMVVRSKTEAKLYEGAEEDKDKLLAAGTTAVNARIESILGTDLKTFKSLRYAEQKKTDSILTLGVAKLHAIVDKITGVDDVNVAIAKLSGIQQAQAAVVDSMPEVDMTLLEGEVGMLAAAVDEATTMSVEAVDKAEIICLRLGENETAEKMASGKVDDITRVLEETAKQRSTWNTAEAQLKTAEELIEAAKAGMPEPHMGKVSSIHAMRRDELDAERRKSVSVTSARETLSTDLTKLKAQAETRTAELAEAVKQVPADYDHAAYEDVSTRLSAASLAKSEATNRAKALRAAVEAGKCTSCGRAFDDCADAVEQQIADLAEAEASLVEAESAYASIRSEATAQTTLKTTWEKAEQAVNQAVKRQEDLTASLEATQRRLDNLEVVRDEETIAAELKEVSDALHERLCYEKAVEAAEKALKQAEAHAAKMQAALEALVKPTDDTSIIEADLAEAREVLSLATARRIAARVEYDDAKETANTYKIKFTEVKGKLDLAEAALTRAMADEQKLNDARTLLETAKGLLKFLRDNRDRYVEGTWARFSAVASQFCSACTDGVIEGVSRDAEGDFSYVEDGRRRSIEDASGAQKAVMGLAVQFALATSAPCPLDIIIVDEPTADMDPERSLATTMMLSTAGRQVIMISHSQMDNSICENTIAL